MKVSSAMITAATLGMGLFILIGNGCSSQNGMNDKSGSKMESSMEEPMAETMAKTMDTEPTSSSGEKDHDADMNKKMENDMDNGMDNDMETDEMAKSGHSGMEDEKEGDMHMPSKDSEKMMNQ